MRRPSRDRDAVAQAAVLWLNAQLNWDSGRDHKWEAA